MKEPAEMEVASVFEEVATRNAAIADVTVAFEIPATIEIVIPIGTIVQVPTVVPVAKTVAILVKVLAAGFV
ncbi:MAG: hypothetical protein WAV38_39575 [Xanthobacteraceae bacterium]